jgi:unsaturated rhamnogalacturonyl hydrolase
MTPASVGRALDLADATVRRLDPSRLRWMWGQALLCHALAELDLFLGEDRYLPFYRAYVDRWVAEPPRIDQSDTVAPALAALAVWRRTGEGAYLALAERAAAYIRGEPRLEGDFVNHLGHSPEARFYPRSVWVDSIMMFGVFAARYATATGDAALLGFASRQGARYADLLQDGEDGLFVHSWWAAPRRAFPRKLYWGRGNGWVVTALSILLEEIGPAHPEAPAVAAVLERLSAALLPLRREDGFWETILTPPGSSYPEASATALISGGWMRAARLGRLGSPYLAPAVASFEALAASLVEEEDGPSLPGISAPTIPLPLFPRLGYALTPRSRNLSYGLAAFFLAAIERGRIG